MKIINILITTIILMVVSSACTTIKEVVKEGETKIEYRDRVRVDSILTTFKDSIYINGDTIKIYRDRWRDRVKINTDTVYTSVDKIIEKEKVIVKELTFFEKAKIAISWLIVGIVIGVVASFLLKMYFKLF